MRIDEETIRRAKSAPADRVGTVGRGITAGLGALGGAAASGTVASACGASTLLGSSTLASLLGGIFVTTTPVGWVVGTAAAGAAVCYGAGRLISSGARADAERAELVREMEAEKTRCETEDLAGEPTSPCEFTDCVGAPVFCSLRGDGSKNDSKGSTE